MTPEAAAATRRSLLSLVLLGLAVIAAGTWLDERAETHYEQAFQRALVTFGLARALNGIISVVQGTEVAVEPAGVGMTFAPGEIVDPVNDLIERFSWVMLASTTSLGIQNILMDMSAWTGTRIIAAVAAIAALVLLWLRPFEGQAARWALRLTLLAAFLRLAMPLVVLLNHGAYVLFMEADFEASRAAVEQTNEDLAALSETDEQEPEGLLDRARGWLDDRAEELDLSNRLDLYQSRLADATEHLLRLTAVFVAQTIVLPLLFLWAIAWSVRTLGRFG
ncbi:MAG: hypothetical protein AAGE01_20370 [Pseudomonadota bacterium]